MRNRGTRLAAVVVLGTTLAGGAWGATDKSSHGEVTKQGHAEQGMGSDIASMPMHRQMQQMMSTMAKLNAATDPSERRKLLESHMGDMRGMMKMMHGMMAGSGMMTSSGMMGGHGTTGTGAAGGHHKSAGAQPGKMDGPRIGAEGVMDGRMGMMEQRMNMMQMMMDQMLENQAKLLDKDE